MWGVKRVNFTEDRIQWPMRMNALLKLCCCVRTWTLRLAWGTYAKQRKHWRAYFHEEWISLDGLYSVVAADNGVRPSESWATTSSRVRVFFHFASQFLVHTILAPERQKFKTLWAVNCGGTFVNSKLPLPHYRGKSEETESLVGPSDNSKSKDL